jgi:hypothetical protein
MREREIETESKTDRERDRDSRKNSRIGERETETRERNRERQRPEREKETERDTETIFGLVQGSTIKEWEQIAKEEERRERERESLGSLCVVLLPAPGLKFAPRLPVTPTTVIPVHASRVGTRYAGMATGMYRVPGTGT